MTSRLVLVVMVLVAVSRPALSLSADLPTIPALHEISVEVARARPELSATRASLQEHRASLRQRVTAHNRSCRPVEEGSAQYSRCVSSIGPLSEAVRQHVAESNAFNAQVSQAERALIRSWPNLASDAAAARLSAARLAEVNSRIKHLEDILKVLSTQNPRWQAEWDRTANAMREDANALALVSLQMLSSAVAEIRNRAAGDAVATAEMMDYRWGVWLSRERLQNILVTTPNHPRRADIRACIEAYERLEAARASRNLTDMTGRLQDLLFVTYSSLSKPTPRNMSFDTALYEMSTQIGELAMVFAKGAAQTAAGIGNIAVGLAEATILMDKLTMEQKHLWELSRRSYERSQLSLVFQDQLSALLSERQRLVWAVERAR